MALSIYSAAQASKAKAKQETQDAIARQERANLQFNREQQAYMQNVTATKRQETSDLFNISIAAAEAEDNLALATVGSGLGGASVNELNDEISRQVGADKIAVHRGTINQLDQLDQQRLGANENRTLEANQAKATTNVFKDIQNAAFGAGAQALGQLDPKLFDVGNFNKPSPSVPQNQLSAFNSRSYYGKSTRIG